MHDLQLKPVTNKAHKAIHELIIRNKDRLMRYFPVSVESCESNSSLDYVTNLVKLWEQKEVYCHIVWKDDQIIGMTFIKSIDWRIPKCEMAYHIDRDHEGQGYGSAALEATIRFAFEGLEMNKIFVRISPDNHASAAIAHKCGFKKEGTLRKEFKIETGELIDLDYYGLTP